LVYNINNLIEASKKGDKELIKKILKAGIDINSQDELGFTALHEVTELGYSDLFWFLIKNGANPNIKAEHNFSLLHAAGLGGNESILKYLLEADFDINEVTEGIDEQAGWSALHYAVFSNNIECIKYLLKAGIDIKIKNKKGLTALDLGKELEKSDSISLLVSAN